MENLDRIFFINRNLKKNGKVSVRSLAVLMDVEEDTVREDIRYMNDRLQANIKFKIWKRVCYYPEF
ncbi:MAG: DeoR family transcriptional regulator [Candidatus Delongbacteria bacterium]|nr:DeoR family transcriptional regulator [Candidatus Delongbacteria bacterium]